MALRIALYGYDTDIGKLIIELLDERKFPLADFFPLAPLSGEFDAVTVQGRNYMINAADEFDFSRADAAFFITTPDETARLSPRAREAGCVVIDNSRLYAGSKEIPAILPELNPYLIKDALHVKAVVPASSVTTELALPLAALHDEFGLQSVNAVMLESVSEHGRAGSETLARETALLLNGMPAEDSSFPAQLAFNLHTRIGELLLSGSSVHEEAALKELNALLGPLKRGFSLTCLQVPVFYGHTAVVHFELEQDADAVAVQQSLSSLEYLALPDPQVLLTPVTHGVRDNKIYITRLRQNSKRSFDMVCIMDNTRRGEALNCVQIAELMDQELQKN